MIYAYAANTAMTNRRYSKNVSSGAITQPTSSPTSWAMRCEELRNWISNLLPTSLGCKRKTPTTTKAYTEASSTQSTPSSDAIQKVDVEPAISPVSTQSTHATPETTPQINTPDAVKDHVTSYVDAWYDENQEGIDIGRIDLPLIGEVDVFPAEREKELYRKVFLLAITNLLQVEIKIAGVPMHLTLSTPEASNNPPEGVS